jgi:hypothetical protein
MRTKAEQVKDAIDILTIRHNQISDIIWTKRSQFTGPVEEIALTDFFLNARDIANLEIELGRITAYIRHLKTNKDPALILWHVLVGENY